MAEDLLDVSRRSHNEKIVRIMDPVHNFIDISEYPVIQQLVDTPYFQRLRRLHQLGLASLVYPSATHSRFTHSIGTMHVFLILFDSVTERSNLNHNMIERLRPVGAAAALLHDIGHGPFSHASEIFLDGGRFQHEKITRDIIRNTMVGGILKRNGIQPRLVSSILKHTVPDELRFMSQLISSQLDADRIDYLLRDALFTGVPYGRIDIQRIANTLSIWDEEPLRGSIVVSHKGVEAIEDYLLGRYHMHKGVYHHKTSRCMVRLLANAFRRASCVQPKDDGPLNLTKKVTPKTLLALDDHTCFSAVYVWTRSPDKTLSDLSRRLVERRPLKTLHTTAQKLNEWEKEGLPEIRRKLKGMDLDPNYYLILERGKSKYNPYVAPDPENAETATNHIMVVTEDGRLEEISRVSPLINAISGQDDSVTLFYPKEVSEEMERIAGRPPAQSRDEV